MIGQIGKNGKPLVCRMLRTKTSFGAGDEWKRGESPTAVYWCLATMEAFGADDGYCHPHACVRGRACFEPCAEDEEEA
ncbi:MAG TPA: hypothetical protein VN947_30145 [Polyangia bacterium]|nr:hypothetical protein [Polyangia bacterium]